MSQPINNVQVHGNQASKNSGNSNLANKQKQVNNEEYSTNYYILMNSFGLYETSK